MAALLYNGFVFNAFLSFGAVASIVSLGYLYLGKATWVTETYVSGVMLYHYKDWCFTWRITFIIHSWKCVTVNLLWRSTNPSCISRHNFVGPTRAVTDCQFDSSWNTWSVTIAKAHSDELKRHEFVTHQHLPHHLVMLDLTWQLPAMSALGLRQPIMEEAHWSSYCLPIRPMFSIVFFS
jgi:hypothetical protein